VPYSHGPDMRLGKETFSMEAMLLADAFRDEQLQIQAKGSLPVDIRQLLGLGIDEDNFGCAVPKQATW